jgi:hypothetical protein
VDCGAFEGTTAPVEDVAIDPTYLDVDVPVGRRKIHRIVPRLGVNLKNQVVKVPAAAL